jgi:hypothetical protein
MPYSGPFVSSPDSSTTLICDLPRPLPAADHCLPHAAMGLGTVRAVGTNPPPALVHRLLIQRQMSAWCLFRMDDAGGFIGESWHPDAEDALHTACREFKLSADQFKARS